MNLPNKLTVARCVLTFVFLAVLLIDFPFHYGLSLIIFAVASLTDMLDGKIARGRNMVTNLGKFLDPLADKTLTTAAFLGIANELGGMDNLCWAVMIILTREFAVTSARLLAAKEGVVIAASMAGKLKTVMQMVSVMYMLAAMQVGAWQIVSIDVTRWLIYVGLLLVWISVAFTVVSGAQYVWNCRQYFNENK
ncbi:MAG: CDP-diacylglycerol--glycerol-3-phosphate 3-phosphatidyltransferase [Ruminococcaceae bacterium]|nr:CDP-diacylglycerol--glycerol-3-phosphate 3-phosphatidyltransferase [Oscillospiraceae bacterium]